jgi:hypothetical protein
MQLNKENLTINCNPNTLQRVNAFDPDTKGSIVDTNIGASLHRFKKPTLAYTSVMMMAIFFKPIIKKQMKRFRLSECLKIVSFFSEQNG